MTAGAYVPMVRALLCYRQVGAFLEPHASAGHHMSCGFRACACSSTGALLTLLGVELTLVSEDDGAFVVLRQPTECPRFRLHGWPQAFL